MNIKTTEKITIDEVIDIHNIIASYFAETEDPISPRGVKSRDLLESAIGRPFQTYNRKALYNDIFAKAAALFHSIINNHPFYNGNKRTALIAAQILLAQKNYWLDAVSDKELYEFTYDAAAHKLTKSRNDEENYIAQWFEAYSRKTQKGDRSLTYRALKAILAEFGFTIDESDGRIFSIYDKDEKFISTLIKRGIQGFAPYDSVYIAGLRKRLKLIPEYGVDSARFYGTESKAVPALASELIDLRAEVMRKLAKT